VLRAAGETETAQANIQDWLQLDEGDPGFQFLVSLQFLIKGSKMLHFSCIFASTAYIIKFSIYFFLRFCCLSGLYFASLIRIIA
jgi:hypothetical protein